MSHTYLYTRYDTAEVYQKVYLTATAPEAPFTVRVEIQDEDAPLYEYDACCVLRSADAGSLVILAEDGIADGSTDAPLQLLSEIFQRPVVMDNEADPDADPCEPAHNTEDPSCVTVRCTPHMNIGIAASRGSILNFKLMPLFQPLIDYALREYTERAAALRIQRAFRKKR